MLRELFVSVVSGIIVAMVLGTFGRGGGRDPGAPRQAVRSHNSPPARRGSLFGGLLRFIFSVAGGLALAFVATPLIAGRRFGHFGGYERYDRFGDFHGLSSHFPVLILTVIGTIIVWSLLSALTRR